MRHPALPHATALATTALVLALAATACSTRDPILPGPDASPTDATRTDAPADAPAGDALPDAVTPGDAGPGPAACPSRPTGTTFHVATGGDDGAAGTAIAPVRTIARGLALAGPGDRVLVHTGTYREAVRFPASGAAGRPVILEGEPGATVDAGDRITGWVPAPEVGPNVWKNSGFAYTPFNMTWNGRYVVGVRYDISRADAFAALVDGPQGWDTYDGTLYRSWDGVEALYATFDGTTYVRFATNADPNAEDIEFSPERRGAVTMDAVDHVTVCGLTLRGAGRGVNIINGASHAIAAGNTVVGGHDSVMLSRDGGSNLIAGNEITLNYLHSLDPNDPRHWFIWAVFKIWGDYDRSGVQLFESGHDNVVSGNHIFEHWDGIQDAVGTSQLNPENFSNRLRVADNTIEHLADDGLEPTGTELNAEWHHNLVRDCNIALRVKTGAGGPLYVYRNRLQAPRDNDLPGENLALYVHLGTTAEVYLYHNSFSALTATALGGTNAAVGVGNFWYVNNVISGARFGNGAGTTAYPHFDYNWVGGEVTPASYMGPHNVLAPGAAMWPAGDSVMALPAGSPARGSGLDLSRPWTVDRVSHPALPGMSAGYFTGAAPDMGYTQ